MITSLYTGATGMKTHTQGMDILSNDIANVNTVAYKDTDYRFGTLLSEQITSSSNGVTNYSQKGLGVGLQDVATSFSQGSLLSTNIATDLAISGEGFFRVASENEEIYYTRAGNFNFDNEGRLVDPSGNIVQGQAVTGLDENGENIYAETGNVQLNLNLQGQATLDANATSEINYLANLDGSSTVSNAENPYFSLLSAYNAENTGAPVSNAAYQESITVYDSEGNQRDLTLYFDKVGVDETGQTTWEYVAAIDAEEDGSAFADTEGAGLLAAGTLTFNSSGNLTGQSAFTNTTGDTGLENWTQATFDDEGIPQFTATFDGGETATIAINFGFRESQGAWSDGAAANAAEVGTDAATLPSFEAQTDSAATSAYTGQGSFSSLVEQDGYDSGVLQNISFTSDGIMTGQFSNGESADLYRLPVYEFTNEDGLRREGNNLYSQTNTSGEAAELIAGQDGAGEIVDHSLEQSNVDLADEFVSMITTQRGFQANSKVVTTSDEVLQTAINMKR